MSGPIERRLEQLAEDIVRQSVAQIGEAQASLGTQLAESVGGVLLKGSRYVSINGLTGLSAGDLMLAHSAGRLTGVSIRETGGINPVSLHLHDGADATAPLVCAIKLAAGASLLGPLSANPGGVFFAQGLFMELGGTGLLSGAVYLGGSD